MYPLVRELAAAGIPVTVTCRVVHLSRQPYYRWLARPVPDSVLVQAYRANALFDAHRDEIDLLRERVNDIMKNAIPMAVQMETGIGTGENWLLAH